jgi:hypothetical protein
MGVLEDVGLTPRQISASWRPVTDWYQRWGSGLEETTRGLPQSFMDVGRSISGESPVTPDRIVQEAGRQTLEHLRDPVRYFSEDPAGFSLDALGLAGGARSVLRYADDAARYAGYSGRADWLSSETGALTAQGRHLNAVPLEQEVRLRPLYDAGDYPTYGPRPVEYKGNQAWFRPAGESVSHGGGGAGPDVASYRLAEAGGMGADVPGAAIVNDRRLGLGALIEDIPDLRKINRYEELERIPGIEQALRRQSLLDIVTGNVDRGVGHNMWASGERQLVPGDFNVAWPGPGMNNFAMKNWFGTPNMRGSALAETEMQFLQNAMRELQTNPRFYEALVGQPQAEAGLSRAMNVFGQGRFPPGPSTKWR